MQTIQQENATATPEHSSNKSSALDDYEDFGGFSSNFNMYRNDSSSKTPDSFFDFKDRSSNNSNNSSNMTWEVIEPESQQPVRGMFDSEPSTPKNSMRLRAFYI